MSEVDLFESLVSASGDRAGVFEYEDETGYFYLYDTEGAEGRKVLGAIHVLSGIPDFDQCDIAVRWSSDDEYVGLFIKTQLWAAFNARNTERFGGNYSLNGTPQVPALVSKRLDLA